MAMKCPTRGTVDLLMADRRGIEIDYCPECRGVWPDHGELAKIIECTREEYEQVMAPMAALAEATNTVAMMKMMKGGKSSGGKKMGLGGLLKGL